MNYSNPIIYDQILDLIETDKQKAVEIFYAAPDDVICSLTPLYPDKLLATYFDGNHMTN